MVCEAVFVQTIVIQMALVLGNVFSPGHHLGSVAAFENWRSMNLMAVLPIEGWDGLGGAG